MDKNNENGVEGEQDYKKKRQDFSLAIRRNNREEIFTKKRNIEPNQPGPQTHNKYVVDIRYADYIEKFQKNRFYLENLGELVVSLHDPDIIKQHYGLIGIRKIMSVADVPPVQPIVDAGVVPRLIEYVKQQEYPQLQLQATWSLANIASGTSQQCQSIVDKGAIPLFINLMSSKVSGILQQAVWGLGNIASDSIEHRDAIINQGGIQKIITAILKNQTEDNEYFLEHSAWALSNLCRGKPLPPYEIIQPAIPLLVTLMIGRQVRDRSIIADCCWALSHNMKSQKQRIEQLINLGFQKFLVKLLNDTEDSLVIPAIRLLGHITMGDHNCTQKVLDQPNFMDYLYCLLNHSKRIIRSETCWIISNIAVGNTSQLNQLLDRDDIMGQLLRMFESDTSNEVRRQISHIFANMTGEGSSQKLFAFFQSVNIVYFYVNNLDSDDYRVLRDILENLQIILKFGESYKGDQQMNPFVNELMKLGGANKLQQLQLHDQKVVYETVIKMLKEFFDIDETLNI